MQRGKVLYDPLSEYIIHGGLRFPLKNFFRDVLAELGIALRQLSANAWRILTALYIDYHGGRQVDSQKATAFLRCYFIQATRSSEEFYFCRWMATDWWIM